MANEEQNILTEQDLSESELQNQDPLENVDDPPVRLAGYNQVPDFGGDTKGTLHENNDNSSTK